MMTMLTLNLQKCRRCGLIKAASEFYKNRLMLDGLYSHCKTCYQASAAARSAARSPVDAKACRRCVAAQLPQFQWL
jgi:ribosomal protein L40E